MVKFSEDVAERTKQLMQYRKEHEAELPPRTVVVQIEKKDTSSPPRCVLEAVSCGIQMNRRRGGAGKGPGPLANFLSGMGFCQFVHYAEHSMSDGTHLDSLKMKIEGKVIEQRPRRFSEISYEVSVTSKEGMTR